jgi:hypothetical protein
MGESTLDYDLKKTLEWCAANGVVFGVTTHGDTLAITAKRSNIFAEYIIDEPFDAKSIGDAMWAALFSVKHGTEYHAEFGHFPPVRKRTGPPPIEERKNSPIPSQNGGGPSPNLQPAAVPRRRELDSES